MNTVAKFSPTDTNKTLETNNENQTEKQQTQNLQSIIDNLLQKNEQQNNNIIEQRKLIDTTFAQKQELENKIALLEKQFLEFKQAAMTNNSNSNNNDLYEKFNTLNERFSNLENKQREQDVLPIVQRLFDLGVSQDKVQTVFDEIKRNYGVDLTINPNLNLVEFHLKQIGYLDNNENSMLSGGYMQTNQVAQEAQNSAEFEAKKQEIINKQIEYYNSKVKKY